jgi:predicted enzyme related to lactoylglutathione lyase
VVLSPGPTSSERSLTRSAALAVQELKRPADSVGELARRHYARRYELRPALWKDRRMLQLLGFIIDCPDPMKLAAFYSQVTGRAVMEGSGDNMAGITFGEVDLAFQRVQDYRPPRWPDDEHPKQYHLDFEVDEIEPEQRRVVKLGATLQKDFIGPEGYGWQVYTDPAGHPFCLCRHKEVTWTDKEVVWP